jgi:hypothetical protein
MWCEIIGGNDLNKVSAADGFYSSEQAARLM